MAEPLFRKELAPDSDITVSSAGVSAMDGCQASSETVELVEKNGASLDGFRSSEVTAEIVDKATHIFCLTKRHARSLLASFPNIEDTRIYLVGDFIELDGKVGRDVPDPFGMGPAAYQQVADILTKATPNLIAFVNQTKAAV